MESILKINLFPVYNCWKHLKFGVSNEFFVENTDFISFPFFILKFKIWPHYERNVIEIQFYSAEIVIRLVI